MASAYKHKSKKRVSESSYPDHVENGRKYQDGTWPHVMEARPAKDDWRSGGNWERLRGRSKHGLTSGFLTHACIAAIMRTRRNTKFTCIS